MADKEIIRTTCTRDCYDSCGIAVVRQDGEVRKVLGDLADAGVDLSENRLRKKMEELTVEAKNQVMTE